MQSFKMNMSYDRAVESGLLGVDLPAEIQAFYGSDLVLAAALPDRAVVSTNFVVRRDGIVNVPEQPGGLTISGGSREDIALMAILRASHDAVLVGSETLAAEQSHLWTARFIYQDFAEVLENWREAKKGAKNPYNVILTRSGTVRRGEEKVPLSLDYPVFNTPDIQSVIVTTSTGKAVLDQGLASHPNIRVIVVDDVDFERGVLVALKRELGVDHLLVEGGPMVNGAFHAANLVSDDFLTLAPGMAGRKSGTNRKALMEGFEYPADQIPLPELYSLRFAGNHLFVRDRYQDRDR